MFNPSRDQARQFLFDTWRKHLSHQPLTDLEKLTLAVLFQHPEYHTMLGQPERWQQQDWPPELGETNPFLHLSLHLAIEEQLSIKQPHGLYELYQQLCLQCGDEHSAQHEVMDGLTEMIWYAQRYQTAPDPTRYLDVLRRKLGQPEQANATGAATATGSDTGPTH